LEKYINAHVLISSMTDVYKFSSPNCIKISDYYSIAKFGLKLYKNEIHETITDFEDSSDGDNRLHEF